MLRAQIHGLALDITSKSPVVILSAEETDKVLPIWIGHFEAWAIAMELSQIKSKRPLTHDLIQALLTALKGSVEKVEITELRDQTFYARIYVERDGEIHEIDARPSDSLAIALKADAPIFVAAELFSIGEDKGLPEHINDPENLKERLRNISPEDFGKYSL